MPESKKTMLEGRLRRRMRALSLPSLDAYCDYLFADGGLDVEGGHLLNAVTTNKTDFFREPAHFEYLQAVILPFIALRLDSVAAPAGSAELDTVTAEPPSDCLTALLSCVVTSRVAELPELLLTTS